MIALSIVIPSYNSGTRLRETLRTVAEQRGVSPSEFETVVVDDGSSDGTREIIAEALADLQNTQYVHRPRDSGSGRATARNVGIAAAKGRIILFIDAGVLLGPGFLACTLDAHDNHESECVVLYKILGLFVTSAKELPADRLLASMDVLDTHPAFLDRRHAFMTEFGGGDDLDLPAPWLLAWTCTMSLPRSRAIEVEGFDTSFQGWGAEDVDFAARLGRVGLEFVWRGDVAAVHMPHERERDESATHRQNAGQLHRKLNNRESELFSVWRDGFFVNLLAARLDRLSLGVSCPKFDLPAEELASPAGRRLCVGFDLVPGVDALRPDVALVHRAGLLKRARATWPDAEVVELLGIALPYQDDTFEEVLLGDLVRLLPRNVQIKMLRELSRVAQRITVVLGNCNGPEQSWRMAGGWEWHSPEDIAETVEWCELTVSSDHRIKNAIVMRVIGPEGRHS